MAESTETQSPSEPTRLGDTSTLLSEKFRSLARHAPTAEQSAAWAAERDERLRRAREEERRKWCQNLWKSATLPQRHKEIAEQLATSATGPWRTTLDELTEKLGTGFIIALLGTRGTGKTQLATTLIYRACAMGRPSAYYKAAQLFRLFRSTYRDHSDQTEQQIFDQLVRYKLLIIDEAHERAESPFEQRVLTQVVDERYDAKMDTLFISNETRETFAEAIGDSVVSRIHECGKAVECNWPSFRTPADSQSTTH